MILMRIFMDRIPDTVEPQVIWYWVAVETLMEVAIISGVFAWVVAG